MKQIFIFLFIFFYVNQGYNQSSGISIEKTSSIGEQVQHLMAPLDMTEVNTQVFYDKGMDFYNWRKFDGDFPSDSTVFRAEHWGLMNFQAASSFLGNYNPLPDPSVYMDYMSGDPKFGPIRIGILALDYQRFRDDAITANLISFNQSDTTLHDVVGRTESPYLRDTMLAACALQHPAEGLDIEFVIPDSLFMGNIALPDSIWLDLGDGLGYQYIDTNTIITAQYLDFGIHVIVFKCLLSNGRILYAKTEIENNPVLLGGILTPPPGYDTFPDQTIYLNGDHFSIFYGNPCKKLLKPLIFIEGINPSSLGGDDFNEMKKRLTFEKDNTTQNVTTPNNKSAWENLARMGYDLIYYDFEIGDGDIIENSRRFQLFMEWVNAEKLKNKSFEKNIVLGASMGGVVGYHALRKMEVAGNNHETEFMITFDAPMKGANVPLGLQFMVLYLGNYFTPGLKAKKINDHVPVLKIFENILNSGAAKQLLYYNAYNSNPSEWHDQFYDSMEAMGSLNIEHIAISNGSTIGQHQELIPSELFMKLSAKSQKDNFFGAVTINKSEVFVMPSSGVKTIYYLDIEKYFQYIVAGYWMRDKVNVKADASVLKNYDVAPGGMTDFGLSQSVNAIQFGKTSIELPVNGAAWGFVPSVSSFDLAKDSNPYQVISNCGNPLISRCISSKDNSTICSYTKTNQHNQGHVSLNSKNATFLMDVLYNEDKITLKSELKLEDRTFNFGSSANYNGPDPNNFNPIKSGNFIDFDLDIFTNSGKLWLNHEGRINYIDNFNNPQNNTSGHYDLFIQKGCSDSTVVTVYNAGEIKIGDKETANNTANLHIMDSARLVLTSNGLLLTSALGHPF